MCVAGICYYYQSQSVGNALRKPRQRPGVFGVVLDADVMPLVLAVLLGPRIYLSNALEQALELVPISLLNPLQHETRHFRDFRMLDRLHALVN